MGEESEAKSMGEVSGTRFVRKSIIAALSENHFSHR